MAAKESAEMRNARRLVLDIGLTPTAAATIAEITPQAIYMSEWYKTMRDHVCKPRKRFTSEQAARAAAVRISAVKKVQRYVEPCSKCNGWHLS